MRAEYIIAASLMGAALTVPAVLLGALGDAVPGLSQGADAERPADEALTLMTPPVLVPNAPKGQMRTVYAELDLTGRTAADAVCKAHPRLADRILGHVQDPGRGPAGPKGHDARLAWLLDDALDGVEVRTVALVDSADPRPRAYRRPLYRCNQGTAWPVPDAN